MFRKFECFRGIGMFLCLFAVGALYSCISATKPPEKNNSQATESAASLINKRFIDMYSDDYFIGHGIRAVALSNSIAIYSQPEEREPQRLSLMKENGMSEFSGEFWNLHYKKMFEIVCDIVKSNGINSSMIDHIIVQFEPARYKYEKTGVISGLELNNLIEQGIACENIWDRVQNIEASADAMAIRKYVRQERIYHRDWGGEPKRDSINLSK